MLYIKYYLLTKKIFSFLDQSIENHSNSEKNITCHLSQGQIEPNPYFHTVIKDEIKNKSNYYNSKGRYNCLLKNDNLSSTNDSYSNKNGKTYSSVLTFYPFLNR